MMKQAAIEFDELCEIKDIEERVEIAYERFSEGKISAKAVRMLWDKLNLEMKVKLLDGLYKKDVRKDNMRRLPPKILKPESINLYNESAINTYATLAKYCLIHNYESSKNQNKFRKFKETVYGLLNSPLMYIPIKEPFVISINNNFSEKIRKNNALTEFNSIAINGFIDDLIIKNKEFDTSKLNLPEAMTIGVELEVTDIPVRELDEMSKRLVELPGVDFLKYFSIEMDPSVLKNNKKGVEVVSPVLMDKEEDWESIKRVCEVLKAIGGTANKTCGGHIHIGTNVLGVDKKAWENFVKVWAEAEPLLYMISNRRGEKTRSNAVKHAKMTKDKINSVNWQKVKILNDIGLSVFAQKISDEDRYKGLNLDNVGNPGKNTIEFRISNGTIDYDIWRENILLYGRLVQMAKIRSIDPTIKAKEFERFFEKDLEEKEKLTRFLDLVFNDEEEKKIFRSRWEYRAGEKPTFGKESITTYKRQTYKEPIKEQIRKISEEGNTKDRIEVMNVLIGEKNKKKTKEIE